MTGNAVGILVHGDNHFIVGGICPDPETARALVRHWSIIQSGRETPEPLRPWRIRSKEFRENLQWAVIVESSQAHSEAVIVLLRELEARGVALQLVPAT